MTLLVLGGREAAPGRVDGFEGVELKLKLQGRSPNPPGATASRPGETSDESEVAFLFGGIYLSEAGSYSGALGISLEA